MIDTSVIKKKKMRKKILKLVYHFFPKFFDQSKIKSSFCDVRWSLDEHVVN